jgi:NADH-quinone oxidoreductase subunit N
MTTQELIALTPFLILLAGATVLLLAAPFVREDRSWPLAAGLLTAVAAALTAALFEPPVTEVARMFATGTFARFFLALWSLAAAGTLALAPRYISARRLPPGEFTALVLFAATGMALLSASTSLTGIFLGLESYSLALYVLIAFNRYSSQSAEAGLKYLVLGGVAAGFLAFAIALIYAASGTLHLPEALSSLATGAALSPLALAGWALLLAAFGFKMSLVPFHFWTPDVYQGSPVPVTGLLATGSKGAVVAILLVLMTSLPTASQSLIPVLWLLAALSMAVGTFCALAQNNVKRMLAYSSVTHMGYVLAALLTWNATGQNAVLFYLVAYTVMTLGAFAALTALSGKEERQTLDDLRGLGRSRPLPAATLTFCLLALAGLPPSAGFSGKLALFASVISGGYPWLALLGILASLFSVYFYLRPALRLYAAESETAPVAIEAGVSLAGEKVILLLCMALTLFLGLWPEPLFNLVARIIP